MPAVRKWLSVLLGCLVVAGAAASPWFHDAEGALNGRLALAIAGGLSLTLLAWAARTPWFPAAVWLAAAAIGQATALQFVNAGILLHYQHYKLPPSIVQEPGGGWLLALLAAQAAAVTAGLAVRAGAIRAALQGRFRAWQVAAAALAACCTAAAVSRDQAFFAAELCFAAGVQLLNIANLVLFALALPESGLKSLAYRFDAWLGASGRPRIDRFAALAALWVTVASATLCAGVYQRHPHIVDEVIYLYNARYFAANRAFMPPPPSSAGFDVDLMEYRPDKWYAVAPAGWPAMLSLGERFGAGWLVDPVLAGINILLAYLLVTEVFSRRTARITVLLLCASPWYLFMGMNFMTHTFTTTCAWAAFWGVALARRTGHARWAWLAGAATGIGSLIRPLDGLIVAVLVGLWAIGVGGRRLRFASLAALAAGTAIAGAAVLPYDKVLTGDPLRSPLMAYTDEHYGPQTNAYGFGPQRGLGWALDPYPGHTPFEALINAELNGSCVDTELFGWSTGSLILIAALLLLGGARRPDYALLGAIAVVLLAYAPYWFSGGPDFGARYWYLILLPATVLTARGLEWLQGTARGLGGVRVPAAIGALALLAVCLYIPWRSADKYYHYLHMRPDVVRLAEQRGFGRSLVLIRGARFPDYASAAIYNPLDLRANAPVYAWDRSPRVRAEVLKAYADRPVWIVDGPSLTHAGFRVAAGPVAAAALAAASGEVR